MKKMLRCCGLLAGLALLAPGYILASEDAGNSCGLSRDTRQSDVQKDQSSAPEKGESAFRTMVAKIVIPECPAGTPGAQCYALGSTCQISGTNPQYYCTCYYSTPPGYYIWGHCEAQ